MWEPDPPDTDLVMLTPLPRDKASNHRDKVFDNPSDFCGSPSQLPISQSFRASFFPTFWGILRLIFKQHQLILAVLFVNKSEILDPASTDLMNFGNMYHGSVSLLPKQSKRGCTGVEALGQRIARAASEIGMVN
jgi:hypothetical protein